MGKEVKKEARKRINSPISVHHFMPIYCDNLLRLPLARTKSLVELVFYFYVNDLIGSNSGQIFQLFNHRARKRLLNGFGNKMFSSGSHVIDRLSLHCSGVC